MAANGPPPVSASLEQVRLQGHLGHLTAQEEAAFTAFKKLAADEGYYTPDDGEGNTSHDDGTLVYVLLSHQIQSGIHSNSATTLGATLELGNFPHRMP